MSGTFPTDIVTSSSAPVAIIGAGPTGATLALLLAKYGVRSLVIDQLVDADEHPRANVWSARSMEVLRSIDSELADEMRELSPPPLKLRYITWCTSLAGVDLGRCVPVGEDPTYTAHLLAASPCRPLLLSQNVADKILRARLRECSSVDFLEGHRLQSVEERQDGVSAVVVSQASGYQSRLNVRYLVGADGAKSAVRRQIGIETSCANQQDVAQIHFRADLRRFTIARPSALFWVMSPEFTGTLSQHTKDDLEWVLTTPVFPAIESAEDFHKERAAQLIRCAIGDNTVPIDVQSVRGWSMALRQPRQYGTKRVLLAGDAAAAFTAHGGFGLNHGIQDAASLAWRLALLLNRPDGDKQAAALVRSYKSERLQVARWTADRARRLVATSDLVLRATGLEPEGFEKLNALSRSFVVNVLPRATARRIFQFLLRLGMKPLSKLMLSGSAGERARKKVALAIDKQREVFLTTGTDLGWSIKHGFVCPEPRPVPTAVHDHEMYCPTTAPGALIPHLWFDEPVAISTRDLVRGAPLTLLALESESARWHDALRSAAMRWGLAIECPAVGTSKGAHFKVDEGAFARTMQIDASGALLVRGDGIVVWRSRKRCTDPVAELRAALTASFNAKELSESSPNQPLEIA